MKTIAIKITSENFQQEKDILLASLSDVDFEGFIEDENAFIGYIKEKEFKNFKLLYESIKNNFTTLKYETEFVEDKNWNELWEKSYDPVEIDNKILIKAPFHRVEKKYEYEVIINPQMAFGTGHHPTTALMIELMLKFKDKFLNKKIADIGCGTGILSIIASKLGGKNILALDISPTAIENTINNAELNKVNNINCIEGSIDVLNNENFDIILANITRDVILEHLKYYYNFFSNQGYLFLSGFLSTDENIIIKEARKYNFEFLKKKEKKEWCAIVFYKN